MMTYSCRQEDLHQGEGYIHLMTDTADVRIQPSRKWFSCAEDDNNNRLDLLCTVIDPYRRLREVIRGVFCLICKISTVPPFGFVAAHLDEGNYR